MGFFTQFTLMIILAFTVSCSKSGGGGSQKENEDRSQNPSTTTPTPAPETPFPTPDSPTPAPETPTPTPETPTPETPTPETPAPETVMIRAAAEFVNITDDVRKDKLERAIQLLETVLNTPILRQRILAYTYNGTKAFVDNKSMTNDMVLQSILNGSETLTPGNDNSVNVQLTFYRASNSTVGYTTPTSRLININLKFFDQYSLSQVAGNLVHEWTHKLGWNHAKNHSTARNHSVPYAIGYMVRDIGEDIENE